MSGYATACNTKTYRRIQYVYMTDIFGCVRKIEELSKVCEGPDDHVIVCKPSYHKILRESYICPCDSLGRFI